MGQFLGFGDGSDGDLVISSNTTEAPIDSGAVTDADTVRLDATNASFTANQLCLIHQTYGTGAGGWEVNQIKSYSAGFITPQVALANIYSSGAQVRVIKQYNSITINGGVTYTVKGWNGTTGGIFVLAASAFIKILGTVSANGGDGVKAFSPSASGGGTGGGFRGGNASWGRDNSYGSQGYQGESSSGVGGKSTSPNTEGGGGGSHDNVAVGNAGAGAGGGNGGTGANGQSGARGGGGGGGYGADRGYGTPSSFTTMLFGGGGGGGGGGFNYSSDEGGGGGAGGGIIYLFANTITVTGTVTSNGGAGGPSNVFADGGGGGGGAGGSIFFRAAHLITTGATISALGGAGGKATDGSNNTRVGGAGSYGQIRVEACVWDDYVSETSTNPIATYVLGGLTWCLIPGSMI